MEILKKLLEAGKISESEFNAIQTTITEIESQRDDARSESAARRVKLKEMDKYKKFADDLATKHGVSIETNFDDLTNAIENTQKDDEALKNLQTKYLDDKKEWESKVTTLETEKQDITKNYELRKSLQSYDFKSYDVASKLVSERTLFEDGELKYNDNGVYIPLKEGLDKFAKEYEWMINPQGQNGSGADGDDGNNKPKTLTEQHLQKRN